MHSNTVCRLAGKPLRHKKTTKHLLYGPLVLSRFGQAEDVFFPCPPANNLAGFKLLIVGVNNPNARYFLLIK